MCSAKMEAEAAEASARTRIRDAAIAEFGNQGFQGTGMRSIAAAAGVSPALVVHHFGSKEGLRQACDEHVLELVRVSKERAMTEGPPPDPFQMLRDVEDARPLLRYVARMLVEGSPGLARFVDSIVSDAVRYMEDGVAAGTLNPTAHPFERAVVLTIWQLGAVALHRHVERLIGVDLLEADPNSYLKWARPAVEVFTHGLFADDRWERAVERLAPAGTPPAGSDGAESAPDPEKA